MSALPGAPEPPVPISALGRWAHPLHEVVHAAAFGARVILWLVRRDLGSRELHRPVGHPLPG